MLKLRLLRQHLPSPYRQNRLLPKDLGFPFLPQNRPNDRRRLRSTSQSRAKRTMQRGNLSSPQQRRLVRMGEVLGYRVCCPCCLRQSRWHLRNPHNQNGFLVEGMDLLCHSTQPLNQQSDVDPAPRSGCNEVIYEAVLTISLIAPVKSEFTSIKWITSGRNCVQDIHWRLLSLLLGYRQHANTA